MSLENFSSPDLDEAPLGKLRAALGPEAEQTPEIVAIFQQIKNLRECDRSLRSIRRNLELDNIPTLDVVEDVVDDEPAPQSELSQLLDSFLTLQKEKEQLSERLAQMVAVADRLEAKVNQLTSRVDGQA